MNILEISKKNLNDYTFFYQEIGIGTPILLIHGSLCDLRYWKFQINDLSNYFHIYTVSLRDYWPNKINNQSSYFSIDQHAQDIILFIESVIGKKTVLIGHSRGGSIALKVAMDRPDLINHLILADPGLNIDNYSNDSIDFRKIASNFIENGDIDLGLSFFIDQVSGQNTWKMMSRWFKNMVKDNAFTLISQANENKFSLKNKDLGKINIPTLLIGGEKSPEPYPSIIKKLGSIILNSKSIIILGSSHGMNIGNAKKFNKYVKEFLLS